MVNGSSTVGPVFQLQPIISGLSPSAGPVGTVVTITGSNFGSTQGSSSVSFGQFFAVPAQWSEDKIVVPVPTGAVTSSVIVTIAGMVSNALPFTIGATTTGMITGTITQSDGVTPIVGATVSVLNGNSLVTIAVSGASGTYSVPNLNVATYSLQATAFGYSVGIQSGVSVSQGQATGANFSLSGQSTITYTYDELGRLVGVADSISGAAGYSYDPVGNILSITRPSAGQVYVLDFTPKSGPVGTPVTISGTSFSGNPQQDTVTIGGTTSSVSSATSNLLTVLVPATAMTGPITVTTPGGTTTSSASFTVMATANNPTITSFTPPIAVAGETTVTITGTGFDVLANDRVEFGGMPSYPTSATATSISVPVPATAESGLISVATPAGIAISSAELFVIPTPYSSSQVDFTGQLSVTGPYTGTIAHGGDIGLVVFNATAGQNYTLLVNGSTIAGASISILDPGGLLLEQTMIGVGGTVLDNVSCLKAGAYTIMVMSNDPTFTGSLTMNLSQGSSPTNSPASATSGQVVVSTPGQTATVLFYGNSGQSASVGISNSNFPGCASLTFSIFDPTGVSVGNGGEMCDSSGFVGPVALTTAGTYSLLITPRSNAIGTANVTVSLFNNQTTPVSTIVNETTATPITISEPGQNAQLTFNGSQNQLASVWISNSTFPNCASLNFSILGPTGQSVGNGGSICDSSGFVPQVTLPSPGTYTLLMSPTYGGTGSAVVAISQFSEVTGAITPGTPTAVAINMPGQYAQLTFNGNVGQVANVQFTSNFASCYGYAVLVSIFDQSGNSVTSGDSCSGSVYVPPVTFTTAGTYTLKIAPANGNTGVADVTLTLQ